MAAFLSRKSSSRDETENVWALRQANELRSAESESGVRRRSARQSEVKPKEGGRYMALEGRCGVAIRRDEESVRREREAEGTMETRGSERKVKCERVFMHAG